MGKKKKAKKLAQAAAKRRRIRRRGFGPPTGGAAGGSPARSDAARFSGGEGAWADSLIARKELSRDLARDLAHAFQHLRKAARANPLLRRRSPGFRAKVAGDLIKFLSFIFGDLDENAPALAVYRIMGTRLTPPGQATKRVSLLKRVLRNRELDVLPELTGPDGWLGCWTVRPHEGRPSADVVDWLAAARPAPGAAVFPHVTQAARGARGRRSLTVDVEPPVMVMDTDEGEQPWVEHFVGWRVQRRGLMAFFVLQRLRRKDLSALVDGFWRDVELGRVRTPDDWDGRLLGEALTLQVLNRKTSSTANTFRVPGLWGEAAPALTNAWRRRGATPSNPLGDVRTLLQWGMPGPWLDPGVSEHASWLGRTFGPIGLYARLGRERITQGPLRYATDAARLLAVRLALAPPGEEAIEACFDALRRALHVLFMPAREDEASTLRDLWDEESLAEALPPGAMERLRGWDEASLRRRPWGWLGLPPEHPAASVLGRGATVQAAVDWAEQAAAAGEDGAASVVLGAYARARAEARFLAIHGPPPAADEVKRWAKVEGPALWVRLLSLGWRLVFDERAGATPLDTLALPKRLEVQLATGLRARSALDGWPQEGPRSVVHIPDRLEVLLSIRGVGPASAAKLLIKLREHALGWREAFVPADAARAVARVSETAREEARASLSDGLDALADLFGEAGGEAGEAPPGGSR